MSTAPSGATGSTQLDRLTRLSEPVRVRLAAWIGDTHPFVVPTSLAAYYVAKPGASVSTRELREFVQKQLPVHMVPGLFAELAALPRTRRGKVDKDALPDPRGDNAPTPQEPGSELESELIALWSRVLGVERIGTQDSFFEIGGDSLLGIQLLGFIRQRWDVDLAMGALFDHPTVSGMAAQIQAVQWLRDEGAARDSGSHEDTEEIEF